MLVVSFYTPDYEAHADRLRSSCERFGLHHCIGSIEDQGSWVKNCACKAGFIRFMLADWLVPILWLDADAEILRPLDDLKSNLWDVDFAIYRKENTSPKWTFRSGTVYFASTPAALDLAERWTQRCAEQPKAMDQRTLLDAWNEKREGLRTRWLDVTYCQIFDEEKIDPGNEVADPHIIHYQESRNRRRRDQECRSR